MSSARERLQRKVKSKQPAAATAPASAAPIPASASPAPFDPAMFQRMILKTIPKNMALNILTQVSSVFLKAVETEKMQHDFFIGILNKSDYSVCETTAEKIMKEAIHATLMAAVHLKLKVAEASRLTKYDCMAFIHPSDPMTEDRLEFQSLRKLDNLITYTTPQFLIINIFGSQLSDVYLDFKRYITYVDLNKALLSLFPALALPKHLKKKQDLIEKIQNNWALLYEYSESFLDLRDSLSLFASITDCSEKLNEWQTSAVINLYQQVLASKHPIPSSDLTTLCTYELKWIRQLMQGASDIGTPDLRTVMMHDARSLADAHAQELFGAKKVGAKKESKAEAKPVKPLLFSELCEKGNLSEVTARINTMRNNSHKKGKQLLKSNIKKNNELLMGLYHACEQGHITIVKFLLENIIFDQDINFIFPEKNRKNCLMIAAEKKYIPIIKLLLEQPCIQPSKAFTSTEDTDIRALLQEKMPSTSASLPAYPRLASAVHISPAPSIIAEENKSASLETEIETINIYFDNAKQNLKQLEANFNIAKKNLLTLQSLLRKDIDNKNKIERYATSLTEIKTELARLQAMSIEYQTALKDANMPALKRLYKNYDPIYLKSVTRIQEINAQINLDIEQHMPTPASPADEKKNATPSHPGGLMSASAFWHSQGHYATCAPSTSVSAAACRERTPALHTVTFGAYLPQAAPSERTAYFAGLLQQFIDFNPDKNLILKAMQMDAILRFMTMHMEDLKHITGLETLENYQAVRNGLIHRDKLCLGMPELEFLNINTPDNITALNNLQIQILALAKKIVIHLKMPTCAESKISVETDLFYREAFKHSAKRSDRFSEDKGYCYAVKIKNKQLRYQNEVHAQRLPKDSILHKMHEYAQEMAEIRGNICAKRTHAETLFGDARAMRHTPSVVLPTSPSVTLSRGRHA